jgi:hypothetical protein
VSDGGRYVRSAGSGITTPCDRCGVWSDLATTTLTPDEVVLCRACSEGAVMLLQQYWCRQHGLRTTALLDPLGRYRCDAARGHGRRLCDTLLEPRRTNALAPTVEEAEDAPAPAR